MCSVSSAAETKSSIIIRMSFLDITVYSEVLKMNISTPQFARLERRTETWPDEARVKTEKQLIIAANANIEAEKAPTDTSTKQANVI